jgi:hypothetical protein
MPRNFSLAVNKIPHFNAMPVYGKIIRFSLTWLTTIYFNGSHQAEL